MHLKYIFTCLAVGSIAANIGACASTNANSESRLYFKSQANEFEIAPRCLRSVSMNEDEDGRDFITVDFIQSAECYDKLDNWIRGNIGEDVKLIFDGETVSGPSRVVGPLAADNVWIGSENSDLLSDVYKHLSPSG
ncbi:MULTISPECIES: hypothetical protein [Halomonadaceae]|uniref:hypothetical protein n=1 Tax=Halomonadaceae TaxID=28256 RepID=UPI000BB965EB|nr:MULTISPECIES: hypothetical protein [unclassified Halomonas]PCC20590.1 hypothetical protein CIK78_17660 [Halomonas sp. JB37]